MSKEELNCSFCGRAKPQTQLLIAGLDAHICDKCILQAHGIVNEETSEDKEEAKFDVELHPPNKIKAFLDEYVIGQESAKKILSVAAEKMSARDFTHYIFGDLLSVNYILDESINSTDSDQDAGITVSTAEDISPQDLFNMTIELLSKRCLKSRPA